MLGHVVTEKSSQCCSGVSSEVLPSVEQGTLMMYFAVRYPNWDVLAMLHHIPEQERAIFPEFANTESYNGARPNMEL
jgi:hypothetical protein